MKTGPKYKICRRLGESVFSKCDTPKFQLAKGKKLGVKIGKRPRPKSEYAIQLIEKQKTRYTYGVSNRQLSNYVKNARTHKGIPAILLYRNLETRLDNVVFRLGLVNTRPFARQAVSHGHILVNGRRVTVPSYHVMKGDVVSVREGSKKSTMFKQDEKSEKITVPEWVKFDNGKQEGTVAKYPDVSLEALPFNLSSVIEFYSRV